MAEYYAITGIPLPKTKDTNHPIPIRQEMNKWYQSPENDIQVSLFIQALDRFQQMSWDEKLSFFQVAGIHGFPSQVWDQSGSEGFYCNHQQPTFPTWHRAYLALYEQRIYECMLKIIDEEVPEIQKEAWRVAASHWRLPYWDYAETPALPLIAQPKTISVLNPNTLAKDKVYDPNPLYTYRFKKDDPNITMGDKSLGDFAIDDDGNLPWSKCKGTSRHAVKDHDETVWRDGISDNQKVEDDLKTPNWNGKASGTIKENAYRLFSEEYLKSWKTFSTTKYYSTQNPKEWLSLESIHNMIHLWVGGSVFVNGKAQPDLQHGTGHMMDVPVAAFDPIFWHHHCFIDRLSVIWQTKYSGDEYWFDHLSSDDPKPTDSLNPFHKKEAGPDADYNSNDVRDWKKLNYDYVITEVKANERKDDGTTDTEKHLSRIAQDLNELYSTTRDEVLEGAKQHVEHVENDYIINILYNRYGFNGGEPYVIHVFVGPIDDVQHPGSYRTHPNRVGSAFTFSTQYETTSGHTTCSNCKKQADKKVLSCAQIPITGALIKDALNEQIPGLDKSIRRYDVEQYLEKELKWKVLRINGEEIPAAELPDLKIAVMVGEGSHAEESGVLSRYVDYSPIVGATAGKDGGVENA